MDYLEYYYSNINKYLKKILDEERENIEKATDLISTKIDENRLIHIFGTGGHSLMAEEEMFYRAGGLIPINPIFFSGISLVNGGTRAKLERIPGIAEVVLDFYGLKKGDVLIISNVAGVNALTIESALVAKKMSLYVIGIESKVFANSIPKDHEARHKSGKNLHDVADICIDIKVPSGDAVIKIEGIEQKVAPISTICTVFTLHSLVIRTIEKLLEKGIKPPIWRSVNIPNGDQYNKEYLQKYTQRIKKL